MARCTPLCVLMSPKMAGARSARATSAAKTRKYFIFFSKRQSFPFCKVVLFPPPFSLLLIFFSILRSSNFPFLAFPLSKYFCLFPIFSRALLFHTFLFSSSVLSPSFLLMYPSTREKTGLVGASVASIFLRPFNFRRRHPLPCGGIESRGIRAHTRP